MKIAIIGAGNTGQAAAVYLAHKGADCILNTRSAEKAAVINASGITAEGPVSGNFKIPVTTDLGEAVHGADLIIIMTIANAHAQVAERLKSHLEQDQTILIFNSNWGAYQFTKILGDVVHKKNITVAETSAQLFVGSANQPGKAAFSVKEQTTVAAFDKAKTDQVLRLTKPYLPQLEKASSIIETTMATTNPVIHVPITLFNAVRVENAQPFKFYGEGVSHGVVQAITGMDAEKVRVAGALGCTIDDVLTSINSFWEVKHDNLFDALTKNDTYLKAMGPASFEHRFLTEDVPFGIAPVANLGTLLGIETPYTNIVLNSLKMLLGKDLGEEGAKFSASDVAALKNIS